MKTILASGLIYFLAATGGLLLLTASALCAQTTVEEFKALRWDTSQVGTPLDLSRYRRTFIDNFDAMSVTPDGGKGPWFAPIHTDFGSGTFLPPGPNGPFFVADGKLTIRAEKKLNANGKAEWKTGSMQTVDGQGRGFAQQYGYFEMNAEAPPGAGTWMGFWLLSQNGFLDKTKPRTEIDIVEWYGGDPKGLHSTPHIWPAAHPAEGALREHVGRSYYYNLTSILTDGKLQGFHTYGAEITPDWVTIYFDHKETGRFKCLPEFKTPLYLVTTLAILPKEAEIAVGPKNMIVDYVAAYVLK